MTASNFTTSKGVKVFPALSAIQKAIRRGDALVAGWFALELREAGLSSHVWNRLRVITAEACQSFITTEILALEKCYKDRGEHPDRKIFLAKAIVSLCHTSKSRDADHLCSLVWGSDTNGISEEQVREICDHEEKVKEIPEYAFDYHTKEGRSNGKTKEEFFVTEHESLNKRGQGFFHFLIT